MHHAGDVARLDFVDEVVCCDIDDKCRASAAAEGFPVAETVGKLLAASPDAAIVVTPPAAHAGNIRECFEAGVPVLTEKPLATTLGESGDLVEMAASKGLAFQVGFELRYCGLTVGMREVVDSGIIGEPRHMALVQLSGGKAKAGYMTRERTGGIFYEKLCHQLDIFRYWFGEPESVMAVSGPGTLRHYDVEDNVLSCTKFPGGATGSITFLTTRAANIGRGPEGDGKIDSGVRGHFYELILTCTGGSVTYDAWTERLEVVRSNHRSDNKTELVDSIEVLPRWGEPSYAVSAQDSDFLSRVAEGRPPQFPACDALESMKWVARAEESLARGGQWITSE